MKTVLITGAARGIGVATARHLAGTGYHVYAMVRPSSDPTELGSSPNLTIVVGDVTDAPSIDKIVQKIIQEKGHLDVVINNACHVVVGTCETCSLEEQQESMNVNYFGPVRVLQSVLPHMRRQRSGQIIQISSVAGYEPFPHLETYVASKYALEGLTESLASHLAPWNIRISLIQPGGVKTEGPTRAPMGSRTLKDTDAYERYLWAAKQKMIEGYDQSMEPEEVVQVIEEILRSTNPHLRYPLGEFAIHHAKKRFQDATGDSYVESKNQFLAEFYPYHILGKKVH
jgi:NAD(P)-dependent dehydrogenase (short-subunit alcohol dehydrogenase family)